MTVTLGGPFETKTVTLPVTVAVNGGATEADYSGIPEELVFAPGDTEKTFTVTVVDDAEDDDGESLTLSFGEATGVKSGGNHETATLTLTDDDTAAIVLTPGGAGDGGKPRSDLRPSAWRPSPRSP